MRKAIVDSGTSLLAAPSADIKAIAKLVGAHTVLPIPPFNKEYMINCTAPGPDIVIKLGGMSYTLTKEDYTINDAGQCLFAMTGLDVRAPPPAAHTPVPIARATAHLCTRLSHRGVCGRPWRLPCVCYNR